MVCGETLLVNGDLVRMFQQEFPGAKRDLSAIYVSLQRSRPVRKTENYDPERDPIIHIQLCYSMQACQCVLLCTKKINPVVTLTNTSLWAGFEMKNVFLISQFQEEKPFVI